MKGSTAMNNYQLFQLYIELKDIHVKHPAPANQVINAEMFPLKESNYQMDRDIDGYFHNGICYYSNKEENENELNLLKRISKDEYYHLFISQSFKSLMIGFNHFSMISNEKPTLKFLLTFQDGEIYLRTFPETEEERKYLEQFEACENGEVLATANIIEKVETFLGTETSVLDLLTAMEFDDATVAFVDKIVNSTSKKRMLQ